MNQIVKTLCMSLLLAIQSIAVFADNGTIDARILNPQYVIKDKGSVEEVTLRAIISAGEADVIQWQKQGKNIDGANELQYSTTETGEFTIALKNSKTGETFYSEPVWIIEVEEITSVISYYEDYTDCGDKEVKLGIIAHIKAGSITSPCPAGPGPEEINANSEMGTQSILQPFKYTWYKNGVEVTDKDPNDGPCVYTVKSDDQNGVYTCKIEGMGAEDTSDEIVAYLAPVAEITAKDNNTVATVSNPVVLEATNKDFYTYSWTKNGKAINVDSYQLSVTDAGEYVVTISNGHCTTQSEAITVTEGEDDSQPVDEDPLGATILNLEHNIVDHNNTEEITLRAKITSGTPDVIQWQRGGKNIEGANSLEYTTTQDGEYVIALKNNTTGETYYSDPVWIYEVEEITSIITYSEDYQECGNKEVVLSILAHVKAGNITSPCPVGTGPEDIGTESILKPFKYTWYKNGVEVTDKDLNESPCNYTVKDASQTEFTTCVVEGMDFLMSLMKHQFTLHQQ